MSEIGVILVNHRSEQLVDTAARRLGDRGMEVTVVDNSGSYRGAGAIVDPGGNVGFGSGCNYGEASLSPAVDVVCLHNPDVEAEPSTIVALADRLRSASGRVGVLAPAVRDATTLRPAGYQYPSPKRELFLAFGARRPSIGSSDRGPTGGTRFGTAALLAVHREAWRAVGGFDERYFLYGEDLDLWHRIREAGFGADFAPDLVVTHAQQGGSTLGRASRELLRWLGVELFAATSGTLDWRALRRIHRVALPRLQRATPVLASAVRGRWRDGDEPAEVARTLRSGLVDGTLLADRRKEQAA